MDVQIPSPTVFLQRSPVVKPAPPPAVPKKTPKSRSANAATAATKSATAVKASQDAGVTKPKQSKSRNGCMTCKKKRLKCDETKPGCQQCQKRGVQCEGYKKDYKWRTFEETTFASKPMNKTKKTTATGPSSSSVNEGPSQLPPLQSVQDNSTSTKRKHHETSPGLNSAFSDASTAFDGIGSDGHQESHMLRQPMSPLDSQQSFDPAFSGHGHSMFSPPLQDPFELGMMSSTVSTTSNNDNINSSASVSTFSSGSPASLADLLLPGTDMNQPPDPSELRPPMSPLPYQANPMDMQAFLDNNSMPMDEDFDEEIIRDIPQSSAAGSGQFPANWSFRMPSPASSDSSSSSKSSGLTILAQPQLQASSPEMLMLRFDRQTCGILSIKDGPTENPWRTLVWPLAKDSPALYHAISSMTAFHASKENAEMRVPGVAHMTKSLKHLGTEISNMSLDAALATSLALAFSEGWDEHVSTGIRHLKGARALLNNAVVKHQQNTQMMGFDTQHAMRLKFLCNTFIYMDVIARLTSLEEDNDLKFEEILATFNVQFGDLIEVDPLMGCATTLFPLIGRVANLIQKVRKTETNSLALISQAMELKEMIQRWQIPSSFDFEAPEDPDSEVQHSIQTAEAYRYAILLYLHQAVPEIPSESAQVLSRNVLQTMATVPLSSRTTIVQIFPLLAASCEAATLEDRQWAIDRWAAMISRLKIGNVDSCFKVVQEVWRRRDEFDAEKAERHLRRLASRGVPSGGFVPPILGGNKRKAYTAEAIDQDSFFAQLDDVGDSMADMEGRHQKRRATFNAMNMPPPTMSMHSSGHPGFSRRTNDMLPENIGPEYTVRGRLHWIGVMRDWNWEGESESQSQIPAPCCGGLELIIHAEQFFRADSTLDDFWPLDDVEPAGRLPPWLFLTASSSFQQNSGDFSRMFFPLAT